MSRCSASRGSSVLLVATALPLLYWVIAAGLPLHGAWLSWRVAGVPATVWIIAGLQAALVVLAAASARSAVNAAALPQTDVEHGR